MTTTLYISHQPCTTFGAVPLARFLSAPIRSHPIGWIGVFAIVHLCLPVLDSIYYSMCDERQHPSVFGSAFCTHGHLQFGGRCACLHISIIIIIMVKCASAHSLDSKRETPPACQPRALKATKGVFGFKMAMHQNSRQKGEGRSWLGSPRASPTIAHPPPPPMFHSFRLQTYTHFPPRSAGHAL